MKMFKSGLPFNWPATRAMTYVKLMGAQPEFDLDSICEDAENDADRYMHETADLGTAIHEALANSFMTGKRCFDVPEQCPGIMNDFIYRKLLTNGWKWRDKYNVTHILVEKAMSNDKYAGTLDLFCEMDSEGFETKRMCKKYKLEFPQPHRRVKVLLDWKATNGFYDDMPVKLSAYYDLLKEYGYDPEAMIIARFSKETGSINIKDYTPELEDSRITFDLATKLFHHNFKKYLNELEQEATRQRKAKLERKK